MARSSKLHGRAQTLAEAVCLHIRHRLPQYPSARKQRKHLGHLITELAGFPIDIQRLRGNVPDWVVAAVADRRSEHLSELAHAA